MQGTDRTTKKVSFDRRETPDARWRLVYFAYGKSAREGMRLAFNAAGVQHLRFCVRSLTRHQPICTHRMDECATVLARDRFIPSLRPPTVISGLAPNPACSALMAFGLCSGSRRR